MSFSYGGQKTAAMRHILLRNLGQSDLKITPIGIGAWAIGGGKWDSPGTQDDQESIAAIRAGLDRGMNWIDTAAVYGLGHSETIVGPRYQAAPYASLYLH
jgi:aryl-alcohol dehydrogenase-like predicted oxidoreductase